MKKNTAPKKKQIESSTPPIQPKHKEKKIINNIFDKYLAPYNLYLLLFLIILIGFIAFKKFLTIEYLFYFKGIGSDSINQEYPSLIHKINFLREDYFFKYSFYTGMGDAFVNSIVVDPISWLKELINYIGISFGAEKYSIYSRFPIIFVFYFLLSGIFFYLYLRTINLSKYVALIGSLLFVYSGYLVVGSSWDFFGHVFRAALLLFSFEQFFVKKRWYFFPIAVIYLSGNPFVLYLYSLFLFIYASFRYFSQEKIVIINFFKLGFHLIILGVLGLLINFNDFANSFLKMYFSPRVSGNSSYNQVLSQGSEIVEQTSLIPTMILRAFSSDILGSGINFKGWYNYFEAPLFYIGLLSLLIFPQVFIHLSKKNKIVFGSYFAFWMLTLLFPYLRRAMLAFTGDYFRFGFDFFIPFTILFMAVYALNELIKSEKLNKILLVSTLIVLLIALYFPYNSISQNAIDNEIRFWITILLMIYTLIIWLLSLSKFKNFGQLALLVLVVFELSLFSYKSYQKRDAISKSEYNYAQGGYKDGTATAVNYIKSIDSTAFYRTEKDYFSGNAIHGSLNDALAQGYFGTSSYTSFNQLNYVRFLEETGIIQKGNESQSRWISGLRNNPLLMTFGNVKYYLSKNLESPIKNFGYTHLTKIDSINIFKNEYALPFGYSYSKTISPEEFSNLSQFQKQIILLNACVVEDSVFDGFSALQAKDTINILPNNSFTFNLYRSFTDSLSKNHFNIKSFKHSEIKGTIELDTTKILFFTIPFDNGWSIWVNGKQHTLFRINHGFTGTILEKGNYEIKLEFNPAYYTILNSISLTTLAIYWLLLFYSLLKNRRKKPVNL